MNDLRHALRQLRRNPGFTVVAVLTLALGIAVNTTIFSMLSVMWLRPMAVPRPDEMVVLLQKIPTIQIPVGIPYPDYLDYRREVRAVSNLVAYFPSPVHLSVAGQPAERLWVEMVSDNYFSGLEVKPALGSLTGGAWAAPKSSEAILVVTHDYWQRRFGADPGVIGRTVTVNGRPFVVSAVLPPEFHGTDWSIAVSGFVLAEQMTFVMNDLLESRGGDAFRVMGRLQPGHSLADARAELDVSFGRLAGQYPKEHADKRLLLVPERMARPDPALSEFMPLVTAVFTGLVLLVLLIACANVANLLFARSLGRVRELAIRSSLGATRARLLRQLVAESLLLALIAGVVGLGAAWGIDRWMQGFTPEGDIPIRTDHTWDATVPLFTFVISLVAGILTGLLPAWKALGWRLNEALKEGAAAVAGQTRHPLRSLLVVSQMAICLVLLVAAGLFLKSLAGAGRMYLGFRPDGVLVASLDVGMQGYDDARKRRFCRELLEETRLLPGVTGAALASYLPFGNFLEGGEIQIEGTIPGTREDTMGVFRAAVSTDYFNAAGTPLLEGRGFAVDDDTDAPGVVVVNQFLAERLWPGETALGKRLRFRGSEPWLTVVGVVPTGRYLMLAEAPRPFLFRPIDQAPPPRLFLMARAASSPSTLVNPIREAVTRLDPDLPVENIRTMREHLNQSALAFMPLRMGLSLAALQGVIGLLLGIMGLYAVVVFVARQRTREIGLRIALGAQPREILRLVIGDGMRLAVWGGALGLVLASGVGWVMSRLLFGIRPFEIWVVLPVLALLAASAFAACWFPARWAARVDPIQALRHE